MSGEGERDLTIEHHETPVSTVFSHRFKWVREAHTALITIWIPLNGKIYELEFKCKARDAMPKHSGIVTK